MKIGISSACFYPELTEIAVEKLVKNDVKNIEIFLNSFSELTDNFANKINQIIKDKDVKITSIHPFTSAQEPIMFFSNYERRVYDSIEEYKKYFHFANLVGAKLLVFHGNSKRNNLQEEIYFERFARLQKVAREQGVILAQENVAPYQSHSLDFLINMKNYFNNDIAFVLDIKQTIRAKQDTFKFVEELGECIEHIHISDNNSECDCLPIGKGDFDFYKFFSLLKDIKYSKNIMIELYSHNYINEQELYNSVGNLVKFMQKIN